LEKGEEEEEEEEDEEEEEEEEEDDACTRRKFGLKYGVLSLEPMVKKTVGQKLI
jgi:hypothetical protein